MNILPYGKQKILAIVKSTIYSALFFSPIREAFSIYPMDEKLKTAQKTLFQSLNFAVLMIKLSLMQNSDCEARMRPKMILKSFFGGLI